MSPPSVEFVLLMTSQVTVLVVELHSRVYMTSLSSYRTNLFGLRFPFTQIPRGFDDSIPILRLRERLHISKTQVRPYAKKLCLKKNSGC